MRLTVVAIAAAAVLSAMPVSADYTQSICSGHLAAGGPWTQFATLSSMGVRTDAFPCGVGQAYRVATSTVNRSGLAYDIDLYFYDSAGYYISGCTSDGGDESCSVPARAWTLEVTAYWGVDLDVVVIGTFRDPR